MEAISSTRWDATGAAQDTAVAMWDATSAVQTTTVSAWTIVDAIQASAAEATAWDVGTSVWSAHALCGLLNPL